MGFVGGVGGQVSRCGGLARAVQAKWIVADLLARRLAPFSTYVGVAISFAIVWLSSPHKTDYYDDYK